MSCPYNQSCPDSNPNCDFENCNRYQQKMYVKYSGNIVETRERGWYYFDGEPYLPKTYLKKELNLSNKELEKIITNKNIRTEEVENDYRIFKVYNLADARRVKNI